MRDAALGVPGLLLLTSERLLFGSVRFFTVAALHAITAAEPRQLLLGVPAG